MDRLLPRGLLTASLVLCVEALSACHASTRAERVRHSTSAAASFIHRVVPINDAVSDRMERVVHHPQGSALSLREAEIRAMPGSSCRVSRRPECSLGGQCVARIEAVGTVCVVLVSGTKTSGEPMDAYCRDLSFRAGKSAESQTAWERCRRQAAALRRQGSPRGRG